MGNLATLLSSEGHLADAAKLLRETLRILSRTVGSEHPDTLRSKHNFADVLFKEGHLLEGERLQRETLATQFRVLGPDNPYTLRRQSLLADILIREGRYADAEKIARQTFKAQFRCLGPQHPNTLDTLQTLGTAMAYNHRYGEATKLFRDVIEKESNLRGQGNRWSAWYAFACMAATANHATDALQYLHEAVNRGYKDANGLMADDDLKNLRHNPRFQELIAELR